MLKIIFLMKISNCKYTRVKIEIILTIKLVKLAGLKNCVSVWKRMACQFYLSFQLMRLKGYSNYKLL